jgi:hypothetical protein
MISWLFSLGLSAFVLVEVKRHAFLMKLKNPLKLTDSLQESDEPGLPNSSYARTKQNEIAKTNITDAGHATLCKETTKTEF